MRGRNHYPQDIEETAQTAYPGLRPGCCAAFSVDGDGEERLVVAQEVGASFDGNAAEAAAAIRRAIVETHELQTHAVVLLKHGTLPKTSSGKIQRRACRASYLGGTLDAVAQIVQGNADVDESAVELPGLDDLSTLSAGERQERIRRFVLALATQTLAVPAGSLDATRPLAEQGLDSLRAIELKHEIDARFGVDLSIAELLGGMSIAQLAARMEQCEPTTASVVSAPRRRGPSSICRTGNVPSGTCTSSRRRASPTTSASPSGFSRLPIWRRSRRAFATLLERHPALRTTYATRDGVPYQRIGPPTDFALEVQDAGGWDEQTLADRLDADAFQPFDSRTRAHPARDAVHARHHRRRSPDRRPPHRRRFLVARDGGDRAGPTLRGSRCRAAVRSSGGVGHVRDVRDLAGGAPRRREGRGAPPLLVQ